MAILFAFVFLLLALSGALFFGATVTEYASRYRRPIFAGTNRREILFFGKVNIVLVALSVLGLIILVCR